ncbi:tetratricopeptide repeat protein [Jannaschia ovalis]|uniref:Tetratricopeptide repeat-containing protein n=1 Tax=Jannaschia ovalis TaxID=3038773 RepID=A0ABY8LDV2_9RHOB|nr:tetratricopeptide repeat protein [Jannaschia sp. GRR-S6-38]WGH79336.1 hypothetical protein P8627_03465 [Jannaschia sp. GRR-S6-38]
MRAALPLLAALALAACAPDISGRGALPDDPLLPPGAAEGAAIVDPMIVGDRLLAAGEPELALDTYIRAGIDGTAPESEVALAMAVANIRLGRLNQAEDQLRKLTAAEPRNARALNNLGVVLLETGRHGEAFGVLKTAFALQPSPEIRGNLRVAASKMQTVRYDDGNNDAFTLTRRDDGVYALNSPDG